MRHLFLLFGLVSGCEDSRLPIALPSVKEEWAAALVLSESGELVASTGLESKNAFFAELEAPESAASVWVLEFRDSDLSSAVERDPELLSAPLAAAVQHGPILPSPRAVWTRTMEGEFEPGSLDLQLTVPWLPACRTLASASDAMVHASCSARNCPAYFRQAGCDVELELGTSCGLGTVEGRFRSDSSPFEQVGGSLGRCEAVEKHPGSDLALDCRLATGNDCRVDVFPASAQPRFDVQQVDLSDDGTGKKAFLGGIALLDASEIVAAQQVGLSCTEGSRLVWLDRESFEVKRSRPVRPCLQWLLKDPNGDGFFGLSRGSVELVRFDRDGEELASLQLSSGAELVPLNFDVSPDKRELVTWISQLTRSTRVSNDFVNVDLQNWTVTASISVEDSANFPVAFTSSGIVLLDDSSDSLVFYDRRFRPETRTVPLIGDLLSNRAHWAMEVLPDDRILVLLNSNKDSVVLVDESFEVHRVFNTATEQSPAAALTFREDPTKVLVVSGHIESKFELTIFDADRKYFLPGVTTVNASDIPTGPVTDALGPGVFFFARQDATLVRVEWLRD